MKEQRECETRKTQQTKDRPGPKQRIRGIRCWGWERYPSVHLSVSGFRRQWQGGDGTPGTDEMNLWEHWKLEKKKRLNIKTYHNLQARKK